MEQFFVENPLVLLFVVAAIGYLVGNINIKGISLGVAAILFVGLGFGAVYQEVKIPPILFHLGLVIFVYSIGIGSGKAFFKSIKTNGNRDILFSILCITVSALFAVLVHYLFFFDVGTTVGIYAGSTTNTPALAAIVEKISQNKLWSDSGWQKQAVIAYSFTYPMGVMGGIIAIIILEKILKINYKDEKKVLAKKYNIEEDLTTANIRITNANVGDIDLRDLLLEHRWNVIFGRMLKNGSDRVTLATWQTRFEVGDVVMAVGSESALEAATELLGEKISSTLNVDRSEFDVRTIFVSNVDVVGKKISELDLNREYHANITRIRRGDVEMLAKGDTVLEMGDRIRFIARRKDLKSLSKFFGDSYHASSRVNLFSFGLGIALGLLIGTIEITLPGGVNFKLGLAGGPIVVALILGALQRTGPIVWTLPYSANVTLRQVGLIILLAVIGIQSGPAFLDSVTGASGVNVFLGGTIISFLTAVFTIVVGYKFLKIPFTIIMGIISNQPAILEFALSRSKNNLPIIGYTMIFPIALILRIVYAQLLFTLLM